MLYLSPSLVMPSSPVRMLEPELLQNLPRWFIIKLCLLDFSNTDVHYASVTCSQGHTCVLPSPLSAPLHRNNHPSVWTSDHILLLSASPSTPLPCFLAFWIHLTLFSIFLQPKWFSPGTYFFSTQHEFHGSTPEPALWVPLTPHFLYKLCQTSSLLELLCALLFLNPGGRVHAEENRISVLMGTTTNGHTSISAGPLETKVRPLSC